MSVAILSMPNGIDFTECCPQFNKIAVISRNHSSNYLTQSSDSSIAKPLKIMHNDSNFNLEGRGSSDTITTIKGEIEKYLVK